MAVTRHACEWARSAGQELTDVAHRSEVGAESQFCVLVAQKEPTSAQDVQQRPYGELIDGGSHGLESSRRKLEGV
jgi:hypothetical protein